MKQTSVLALIGAISLAFILTGCGGGGGGTGTSDSSSNSGGSAGGSPTAMVGTNSAVKVANGNDFIAAVGAQITLNGMGSTDSGAAITAYSWTLTVRPPTSAATLSDSTGGSVDLVPDVSGSYTVTLTVTDSNGKTSTQSITLQIASSIPVANVVDTVQFTGPSVTEATQNIIAGNIVTLDASGSTDPSGMPLTITWTMLQKPAGSAASLVTSNTVAHFSPDVAGQYQVRARATNSIGSYSDVIEVFDASNAPTTVVVANAVPLDGAGSILAYTGYMVVLDSTNSIFPANDNVVATWTMLSFPAASSTAQLSSTTGTNVNFVPDVTGVYTVRLSLSDRTTGTTSQYIMTVNVSQGPVAVVTGSSAPVALASAPTFVGQAGVPITLRGTGSYDPDGASLTYAWSLTNKPAGSRVVISTPIAQNLVFTPDVNGAYTFTLTVTNSYGLSSAQAVTVDVGSYPPVAIVAQSQLQILLGATVTDSAALSYDQDGSALTYTWSIDAAPVGSTATIANPNSATLSFTPDVGGSYTATVTVSDSNISSVASVNIVAIGATSGTVPLTYLPLNAKFDKVLGKAIIVSTNPNTLHIVDPVAATDVSIALPAAVKSMSLSPNGVYAGVLHEGTVSLVNLSTATLVHSSATGGSQTDVFVTNGGQFYLTGQTGGQWVNPGFSEIDGTSGATLQTANAGNDIYGTTVGIYSDLNNKIFVLSLGLSPQQIYAVGLDGSGNITTTTGSPYWGSYAMNAPFWLSEDQSLLYTGSGDYFSTSNLDYQGTFGLTSPAVLSLSNSSTAQETVLLQGSSGLYANVVTYPSVYKRYTGSLQFNQPDVTLPILGVLQTYGMYIFHASDDSHIMVVQTGGSTSNATGLQYFLLKR